MPASFKDSKDNTRSRATIVAQARRNALNTRSVVYGIPPSGCRSGGVIPCAFNPEASDPDDPKEMIFLLGLNMYKPNSLPDSFQAQAANQKRLYPSGDPRKPRDTNKPPGRVRNGLADFGGGAEKRDQQDILRTALREWMEESACMAYYLREDPEMYHRLTCTGVYRSIQSNEEMVRDIEIATDYWYQQLAGKKHHYLIYQQYCCFLLEMPFIPLEHLPPHEDMHVPYEFRYDRKCYWLTGKQLAELSRSAFHCRIQAPFWNWLVQQQLVSSLKEEIDHPSLPPGIVIESERQNHHTKDPGIFLPIR